ncbi:MAG TPA: hypothetical protein VL490_05395, partial [Mucilaginibacter sp.]|nr:hypothetical protein [Mucilaginibacter sp.]
MRNLIQKPSTKFLLFFSVCSFVVAGVVWACGYEEEDSFSMFSPQAFVAEKYSPFFYTTTSWFYTGNEDSDYINSKFNTQITGEWNNYLNNRTGNAIETLLTKSTSGYIDSLTGYLQGKIKFKKPDPIATQISQLNKVKTVNFLAYLKLAKQCEKFSIADYTSWSDEPKKPVKVSPSLEKSLLTSFNNSTDLFIKQRLLFQLTRYYFFYDDTAAIKRKTVNTSARILTLFNKYKSAFPQNLTYYRTLGYVAGFYTHRGNYAMANYLYSKCYDFAPVMETSSKFSFHAQQESDWQQTLKLAKNKEEKITLWHILGMEYEPVRAIKEIAALNPKSDKLDVLLSRLINCREANDNSSYILNKPNQEISNNETKKIEVNEIRVVDSIARKNNTNKPYYWNIAAGYLHYMHYDYAQAAKFYAIAKKQFPANDKLIAAQYKLLIIFLDLVQLKHIDANTEAKLVEPLNWLKDLEQEKIHIEKLRFASCANIIAHLYRKQGDVVKANCFNDTITFYANNTRVQKLIDLMNKPNKSAFEQTMLRYYPHTVKELYYHQATLLTYKEDIDKALEIMQKADTSQFPANPFNAHIKDCHDCDAAAPT